ncbi:Fibroblast growth factor receptor substrate 3 [Taenia crassiceps]|uniref:Fibroblast growth factor receptor substrate 3 n=1 Tax=Taenia crassiceps TaxID=6207 RepID=A0ABR4QEK5_9CEST
MGASRSRIAANSFDLDDGRPILDGDYDISECVGGSSCYRQGIVPSLQPHAYCSHKAHLLNETGRHVSKGKLELTYYDLLYRYFEPNGAKVVRWPIAGLRGYGYREHLFAFEAGRRCAMSGVFIFKCKGARFLYALLSEHVNTLARLVPGKATTCTCKPNVSRETWKPSNAPVTDLPPEASVQSSVEAATETLAQRRQTHTSGHTVAHFDWARQRRWRLNDDYIYLSRTLPPSSALITNHHQASSLSRPPTSSTSNSPSAGGVYLVAIPKFASAHSYENQNALVICPEHRCTNFLGPENHHQDT